MKSPKRLLFPSFLSHRAALSSHSCAFSTTLAFLWVLLSLTRVSAGACVSRILGEGLHVGLDPHHSHHCCVWQQACNFYTLCLNFTCKMQELKNVTGSQIFDSFRITWGSCWKPRHWLCHVRMEARHLLCILLNLRTHFQMIHFSVVHSTEDPQRRSLSA